MAMVAQCEWFPYTLSRCILKLQSGLSARVRLQSKTCRKNLALPSERPLARGPGTAARKKLDNRRECLFFAMASNLIGEKEQKRNQN